VDYKSPGFETIFNNLYALPGQTRYFKCSLHCSPTNARFTVSCPPSPPPVCINEPEWKLGTVPDVCTEPNPAFQCPYNNVKDTCDLTLNINDITQQEVLRIKGDDTSYRPMNKKIRRSVLNSCEFIGAYDEVWADGICLSHSWKWRLWLDMFFLMLGLQFPVRVYVIPKFETNTPDTYTRMEFDLLRWTNNDRDDSFWKRELSRAKNGDFVQIIDNSLKFCGGSDTHVSYQLSTDAVSSSCQANPKAFYSQQNAPGKYNFDTGQYLFTVPTNYGWGEVVHVHEMLHIYQNVHRGKRLYSEHVDDGECCTGPFEMLTTMAVYGYKKKYPDLVPPIPQAWGGWKISDTSLLPNWMNIPFPALDSEEAVDYKFFTAAIIQSAYRLHNAVKNSDGSFRNHALKHIECDYILEKCDSHYRDPVRVYENLETQAQRDEMDRWYGDQRFQYTMDNTYKLKFLATIYFIHLANKHQNGFTFADFYTYELKSPRTDTGDFGPSPTMGFGSPSDIEMFSLAGFSGRREFLEHFFVWLQNHMNSNTPPLVAAEEISPSTTSINVDIERLKIMNRVTETDETVRCNDQSMPQPVF